MPTPSQENCEADQPHLVDVTDRSTVQYPEQDENGVDLSLLRYMLALSPLERLRLMERKARETLILNEYGRRHREAPSARNR